MPHPDTPPLAYRTCADLPHRPRGPNTTGSGPGIPPGIPPDIPTLRRVASALRNLPAPARDTRPAGHHPAPDERNHPCAETR